MKGHTGCVESVKWLKNDVNLAITSRADNVVYGCV